MRPNQRMPRARVGHLAALLLAPLLLASLGAAQPVAEAGPKWHPVYDDGGTLRWYASFDEARTVAAREGKLILVDVCPPRSRPCGSVISLIGDESAKIFKGEPFEKAMAGFYRGLM